MPTGLLLGGWDIRHLELRKPSHVYPSVVFLGENKRSQVLICWRHLFPCLRDSPSPG
jgi:hypothetical protein